ncbi:arylsulfatase [Lentisphaera marina]|uniref:arylsulfatase n=1 Tax=Lentisphaera marina TaxID=1111041 RepID=UPI0023656669|nr:arylsulfatase [Lentisphaera marina]MDD7984662.1 arylsulfatase [Lentisphaera marina]
MLSILKYLLILISLSALASDTKTNIIFILADDLGYGELGSYGQEKIQTPELDKMADAGIRFTNHYSGYTTCTMSRKVLMTGKHIANLPMGDKIPSITIAGLLKNAGYKTAMIGKWGMMGRPGHDNSPGEHGFDHVFTYDNQGFAHFYYPEFMWRNGEKVHYPTNKNLLTDEGYIKEKHHGVYSHDEFTKDALGFIEENKDTPFFLYLPYTIPHAEITVPHDSVEPYLKLNWPETPKIIGGGGSKDPGYGSQYVKGYCGQKYPHAAYAGMISRMDRDVGRILDLLKKLKIEENTLVLFGSDNGASPEGGQTLEFFQSSGKLRGDKRSIYEAGTRTPFIAYWPKTIQAGQVTDHISAYCDFMATACDVAGIKTPEHSDGVSYLPSLLGNRHQQAQRPYIFNAWKSWSSVRVKEWKLIANRKKDLSPAERFELYNLEKDEGEMKNLATQHPEKVQSLHKLINKISKRHYTP